MNIFIGSSSSDDIDKSIIKSNLKLLDKISKIKDLNLVFGADNHGLMKTCYDAFKANNKKITGITIENYKEQFKELDCDVEITKTTTMERLNEIYKRSDIFLFLPGGIGTFAELFNVIEESRTNENEKIIIVYNNDFFFTPIIKELYSLHEKGFIKKAPSEYFLISNDIEEIEKVIENF